MPSCRTFWNYVCTFPILLFCGLVFIVTASIVYAVKYHPAEAAAQSYLPVTCATTNFSVDFTTAGFVGIGNVHTQNCSWWAVQLFVCEFGESSADCVNTNSQIYRHNNNWQCFWKPQEGCTQPVPRLSRPDISRELFAVVFFFAIGGFFILCHIAVVCFCYIADSKEVNQHQHTLERIQVEGAVSDVVAFPHTETSDS